MFRGLFCVEEKKKTFCWLQRSLNYGLVYLLFALQNLGRCASQETRIVRYTVHTSVSMTLYYIHFNIPVLVNRQEKLIPS